MAALVECAVNPPLPVTANSRVGNHFLTTMLVGLPLQHDHVAIHAGYICTGLEHNSRYSLTIHVKPRQRCFHNVTSSFHRNVLSNQLAHAGGKA